MIAENTTIYDIGGIGLFFGLCKCIAHSVAYSSSDKGLLTPDGLYPVRSEELSSQRVNKTAFNNFRKVIIRSVIRWLPYININQYTPAAADKQVDHRWPICNMAFTYSTATSVSSSRVLSVKDLLSVVGVVTLLLSRGLGCCVSASSSARSCLIKSLKKFVRKRSYSCLQNIVSHATPIYPPFQGESQ